MSQWRPFVVSLACLIATGCDQSPQHSTGSTGQDNLTPDLIAARVVDPDTRYARFLGATQIAPFGITTASAFTINRTESESPLVRDVGNFALVQTSDEIKSLESSIISASVSANYGAFSGEGTFSRSVSTSSSSSNKSLTMAVYRYYFGPVVNILGASFPSDRYAKLTTDPGGFVSTFGNAYAFASSLGGWYVASYTWTESSSNTTTLEEMKMGLSIKYEALKAGGSANLSAEKRSKLESVSNKVTETSTFKSSCPMLSATTRMTPENMPAIDNLFRDYYQGASTDPSRWVVVGQVWKGYFIEGLGPTLPRFGTSPFPTNTQFQAVNRALTMRDPAEFQVDSVGLTRDIGNQKITLSYKSKAKSGWFTGLNLYYTNGGRERFLKSVAIPSNDRDVHSVTINLPSELSEVYSNFGGTTFRIEPVYSTPIGTTYGRDAQFRLSQNRGPVLKTYDGLFPQEYLQSGNGLYKVWMQSDGNLVQYDNGGRVFWHSRRNGQGTSFLVLQGDGNLVTYRSSGGATWATGGRGHEFVVQDDNNIVLYNRANGKVAWSRR